MVQPLFRRKGFPQHRFPTQLGSAVAPFTPVHFDPPSAARQRGVIETSVSLLLTTLAVVTAVQNVVIRDPLYSVPGVAKSAPEWQIPPNLLTTTLVPVVAGTPFKPVDLPLNRRVINVPQFDPVRNISVLQLQAAPFKPVDLPLSRKALQVSGFDPPNVLISIPATVNTPFAAPYVTPIVGVPRQILGFDPPNVTINLPTTVAVPFRPYDWTSPGRARSAPDTSVGPNLALGNAKPFIPLDWGTLAPKARQQVGSFEPPNVLLSTLSIQPNPPAPIVIFDWVLPQRAPQPWQGPQDLIPNLLTSTFNPTSPPTPPDTGAGIPAGDGGKNPNRGFNLADWKKRHKPLKDLEDDIERLYKEITSPPLVRQAEKVVKPFVPPKLRDDIKPSNVEWDKVVQSIRAIEKLHALYEQEIRDDDDDIEDLLTIL